MKIPGLDCLSVTDPSSFSNPEETLIRHAHIVWKVDFSTQTLTGSVKLTVEKIKDNASKLVLDAKDLIISKVTVEDKPLQFTLGPVVHTFGQKLDITLPANSSKCLDILIQYSTSPQACALQWLTPEQTSGKKHPYMFSQCQSIHCRSILPCQDTPAVKFTYSAEVVAASDLTVLLSAVAVGTPTTEPDNAWRRHKYEQKVGIPSYLVAIVVAALQSRTVSPRCAIWAEEMDVDAAAWEFAQVEEMLSTAEDICGPYEWGRYDLLVLPPSFGYGGMENPCITFVTPTCVAGDRTLADVIAHEISHSWTGNSVGIQNFEHFWLNEGWTMFVQRKIESRLFGEKHRQFSAHLGLMELTDEIKDSKHPEFETTLVKNLQGLDPEDVFNKVPYEKGHTLLYYLETLLGGPEVFNPYVKAYTQHFKSCAITTDMFKAHLYQFFAEKKSVLDSVNWDAWFFGVGMPPVIPKYDVDLAEQCSALVKRWQDCNEDDLSPLEAAPGLSDLSPLQQREFLHQLLLSKQCLSMNKLAKMRTLYKLESVRNSETKFRWLRLCIRARWEERIEDALDFATSQGRMKFVRPLFRDLYDWEVSRQRALDAFQANKGKMMYITSRQVALDLHLES